MNTLDAASIILKVFIAIMSLYFLLRVYFLKKYDDKKERNIVKVVGWILFLGSTISLMERFFL